MKNSQTPSSELTTHMNALNDNKSLEAASRHKDDENKNVITIDDSNQNILPVTEDDASEMTTSQMDASLPDWVTVGESVLIRPYNTSGLISFVGPTHFQVSIAIAVCGIHPLTLGLLAVGDLGGRRVGYAHGQERRNRARHPVLRVQAETRNFREIRQIDPGQARKGNAGVQSGEAGQR